MDIFLKNYWSLYNEFLVKFESLTYKGFSIPYLCHFPRYVPKDGPLWNKLYDPKFLQHIQNEVHHQKEIQAKFNQFMQSNTKVEKQHHNSGKVAIHVDKLLRFPPSTYVNSFDANNTIIIMSTGNSPQRKRKKKVSVSNTLSIDGSKARQKYPPQKGINNIPIYKLHHTLNIGADIVSLQTKAKALVRSYQKHHIFGANTFLKWIMKTIEEVLTQIVTCEKMLQDIRVSCMIVSTTHSYINRILAVVAARKGIPTICMQHGIISSELGYIPKIATVDAMYGQFEKDWYERLGVPQHSIEIIGHPRFDQISSDSKLSFNQFHKKLTLDTNKKTILLVVRGNQQIDKWKAFIQALSKRHNFNFIIKNYPSNNPHPLVETFPFVYSSAGVGLYDIFPHVDLVVAYSSTVALEAMIAKKHVFILKDEFEGDAGYFSNLGNIVQSNPQKLVSHILKYLSDSSYKNEVEKYRRNFLINAYPRIGKSETYLKGLVKRLTN